ncbi:hypothetical protein TEA_012917 [Camellia sinensis var. sinensis]|uniref:EGF-like domain-containing protein n=1 Tax=Camellia sinensis var. sinensis TaxID=542762 RepID=A0A4S4DPX1_CAMSN|nr:hypothetical protein TEA_012917 [Camellia sinensis var. sinensis]
MGSFNFLHTNLNSMSLHLLLFSLFIFNLTASGQSLLPDPVNGLLCAIVNCGQGTCVPSNATLLGFECDCYPGWKTIQIGPLTFPSCVVPNFKVRDWVSPPLLEKREGGGSERLGKRDHDCVDRRRREIMTRVRGDDRVIAIGKREGMRRKAHLIFNVGTVLRRHPHHHHHHLRSMLPPPPPPPPPPFTFNASSPCNLIWCGDGKCVVNGTGHYCQCFDGSSNLLDNPEFACFQQCYFGADCNTRFGASRSPPPPPPSNSGSPGNGWSPCAKHMGNILSNYLIRRGDLSDDEENPGEEINLSANPSS